MRLPADYQFKEEIHRGKRSVIWKVERAGKPLIAKGLIEDNPGLKAIASIHNQLQIQQSLSHPGIVKPIELVGSDEDPIIIMEDANRVALAEWINGPLDIPTFLDIAIQLAEVLTYCHSQRVIHKDINPNNILIRPGSQKISLTDFGLAARLPKDNPILPRPSHIEGTIEYLAPEQTGRINRPLDQRSDYYALGITLFQLLTGTLPFVSKDPLELIHAHLAKTPPKVGERVETIPKPVENLIDKLLNKDPDHRYQSGEGLLQDLRQIKTLLNKDELEGFQVGQFDQSDIFRLKDKLYGRQQAIDAINKAFERVCADAFESVLIRGAEGVGKSSLIKEVQRNSVHRNAYIVNVNFTNINADIPFLAISSALGSLCAYLAGQNKKVFNDIKTRILDHIGTSGGILNELIPNLKLIIGEQPVVSLPGAVERQNYLIMGLARLLQSLSCKIHPLLINFENIENADESSLKVIRSLLAEETFDYLLIICSVNEEPNSGDSIKQVIENIHGEVINLENLPIESVTEFVADTLAMWSNDENVIKLSEIVYRKTQGNPALIANLLKKLHADDLIYTRKGQSGQTIWCFDYKTIEALDASESAASLISRKFNSLDSSIQIFLQIASCFPDYYNINFIEDIFVRLSKTNEKIPSLSSFQFSLINKTAFEEGFVVSATESGSDAYFRFVHNTVKTSIHRLLSDEQRQCVHKIVAGLILENADQKKLKQKPFYLLYHLEQCGDAIEQLISKPSLCQYYLEAAVSARDSTSFDKALLYAKKSADLLPDTDNISDVGTYLAVMIEYYQALYLNLRFVIADNVYQQILPLCQDKSKRIRLLLIRVDQLLLQNRHPELVAVGLDLLPLLGIELPSSDEVLEAENKTLEERLSQLNFNDVRKIAKVNDPTLDSFQQVSSQINIALYTLRKPELARWMAATRVKFTLDKGHCEYGTVAYIGYAIFNFLSTRNYDKAYEFGKFAIELSNSYENGFYTGRSNVLFSTLIAIWKISLFDCFEIMRKGIIQCYDVGDVTYAPIGLIYLLNDQIIQGVYIPQVLKEISSFEHFINTTSSTTNWTNFTIYKNGALQLQGLTKSATDLSTDEFTEDDYHQRKHLAKNIECVYAYIKVRNGYLIGEFESILVHFDKVVLTEKVIIGSIIAAESYFYMALAIYAADNSENILGKERRQAFLDKAHANMALWAESCPVNYLHHHLLMQAEKYRLEGNIKSTVEYYQKAIANARECKFHNVEALIHERYGNFWQSLGDLEVAKLHVGRALALYHNWGAELVAQSLRERYPTLLLEPAEERQKTQESASFQEWTLDLASIIKGSQAISSEMDLSHLIRKMLMICVESAGVERGCLFLNREGEVFLEAETNAEGQFRSLMQSLPLDSCRQVPKTVVQYVNLSETNVRVEDVETDTQFTNDPYFGKQPPKSLICMPLVHQSKSVGVLYLENTLTENRFPDNRVRVLNTFLTQSAIAIVNARLYNDLHELTESLERKVEERTRELAEAKRMAERATQSKSEFLATMSHEIRTPMNGVLGMTQLLQNTPLTSDQQELLRTIQSSGESLLVIINDILDFSKIEAGKMELEHIIFSVPECIHDIVDMLAPSAQNKGLEMIIDYHPELPKLWIGDKIRLRQIITNFVNNAIKFTDRGSVTLKVSPGKEKESDDLLFEIIDTGAGIPKARLDRLFKAFSQVDASSTRNAGGTGLGLVIAQRLAEAMQGKVGVDSKEGEGSRFWFGVKLPKAPVESMQTSWSLPYSQAIVIEPIAESREVLTRMLEHQGLTCESYSSVDAVPDSLVDALIFLPYPYPLEEHSSLEELQQHNQIVLLSTFPAYGTAIRLKQQLNVDVLTKPVTPFGLEIFLQQLTERTVLIKPKAEKVMVDEDAFDKIRILLAEDNPVNQKVAQGILKKIGYSSTVAKNGREVISAYQDRPWDLILMDCQMPEMDGFEATEAIRRLEKDSGFHIPIIALTANAMQGDEQRCIRAGMDDYLAKPIQKEQLARVIAYHLRLSEQNAQQF